LFVLNCCTIDDEAEAITIDKIVSATNTSSMV